MDKAGRYRRDGGIIVWCLQNCSYKNREYQEAEPKFIGDFPQAEIQKPITLPRQTDAGHAAGQNRLGNSLPASHNRLADCSPPAVER